MCADQRLCKYSVVCIILRAVRYITMLVPTNVHVHNMGAPVEYQRRFDSSPDVDFGAPLMYSLSCAHRVVIAAPVVQTLISAVYFITHGEAILEIDTCGIACSEGRNAAR